MPDDMRISPSRRTLCLLIVLLVGVATSARAQWRPSGTLNVPEYNYSFLAASPKGDLLAATFNNASAGDPPASLPALLIREPGSAQPQVLELCSIPFGGQRGYGGIAADPFGDFFVTGDTGESSTCFISKFRSDGQLDVQFGNQGVILPNRRCLGIDVLGRYLFVALDWGEVHILDAKTGQAIGVAPKAPGTVFLRDVAVDPRTMRIFGVAKGSVIMWQNGAPWAASDYAFYSLTPPVGELRSGEGISIDPIRGVTLITPIPGNTLREIRPEGGETTTVVTTAAADAHLADSVLSFDGTTLFLSDMKGKRIHVLRRQFMDPASTSVRVNPSAAQQTPAVATPSEPAPKVKWFRSYNEVVQPARERGLPMVVYFGRQDQPKCQEFQSKVLMTDAFNQRAQGFVCVYEDVGLDQLTAYRFGAYRIPFLAVLDKRGGTVATFVFNIDQDELFRVMGGVR